MSRVKDGKSDWKSASCTSVARKFPVKEDIKWLKGGPTEIKIGTVAHPNSIEQHAPT